MTEEKKEWAIQKYLEYCNQYRRWNGKKVAEYRIETSLREYYKNE